VAENDLIHIFCFDSSVGERRTRRFHHKTFDGLPVEPAEGRVRPTYDAAGHRGLLAEFWSLSFGIYHAMGWLSVKSSAPR
jgi:hypothetical protein